MPFHRCSWVLILQLPLCIFPSTHCVAYTKSNMGDSHKSSVLFKKFDYFFEPVTNSLVVPVNSEGSLLALIKFSEFIFSPGIGVMLVEVIIRSFVCLSACDFPLPVRSGCFASSVHRLLPPVLHYLAAYYSFSVDSNSWSMGRITLCNILLLLRCKDMEFSSSGVKITGDSLFFYFRGDIFTCMLWKSEMLGSDVSSSADNTCRGCYSTLVLLPSLLIVHIADWVSSLYCHLQQTEHSAGRS